MVVTQKENSAHEIHPNADCFRACCLSIRGIGNTPVGSCAYLRQRGVSRWMCWTQRRRGRPQDAAPPDRDLREWRLPRWVCWATWCRCRQEILTAIDINARQNELRTRPLLRTHHFAGGSRREAVGQASWIMAPADYRPRLCIDRPIYRYPILRIVVPAAKIA
jgi:hypothetical protein